MQIRVSELWEAYLLGSGIIKLSGPRDELPPQTGRGLPSTQYCPPPPAPHSLAEIAGTAGREGQRADIGMAGIKGGPQQCLTAVIHTLGQGPGARAGGWQGQVKPSDFASPIQHPNLSPRERKGRVESRQKGHGHQQPWAPAANDFPRSRRKPT